MYQLNVHAISKSSFHVDPTCGAGYCHHCPPSECLINCKHNEYLYNGVCLQCPCEHGCIRGSDCKNNIDPLCETYTSFTECDECVPVAVADEQGVCHCRDLSEYDPDQDKCVCIEGYTVTKEDTCEVCGNYYKPQEVTAEFTEDYRGMELTFGRPLGNKTLTCEEIFFPETYDKLG